MNYMYLLIALAPLCWAGDIVLAKGLSSAMSPFGLVFWRWFIAALFLLPFAKKQLNNDFITVKNTWGTLWLLSALGMSVFIALLYIGVRATTVINSAIIQTTIPAIVAVLGLILFGDKVNRTQIFGLTLCILGAIYVVVQGQWHDLKHLHFAKGDLFILVASVLYGLYSVLLKKRPPLNAVSFLFITSLLGAITMFPFYLWEIAVAKPFVFNLNTILGVLYVALFPSIVAYLCWNKGIQSIGPTKTSLFMNLTPLFAALLSILFLGEAIKTFHIIGMFTIFSGMMIFNYEEKENNVIQGD